MQTHLSPEFKDTRDGQEAEAILRKCVHCGFCTATCPTYQLLGDELDGPRGRIYLMKQVLEGGEVTRSTQQHLDRCLTCRNCESTCPSGVEYGKLIEIGRKVVDQRVKRPAAETAVRWLLKEGLTSSWFAPAIKIGQWARPLLPAALKHKLPAPGSERAQIWPTREHRRKVLVLAGCVQPALMPNINSATARVLDAAGIQSVVAVTAGCCGALRTHLTDHEGGLADMRRNIDAWWPMVCAGAVEAIVINASACAVAVKQYGHALAHDPVYAQKAARISEVTRDLSELLPDLAPALKNKVQPGRVRQLAFHPPCTLQHGQQLRGGVETHLNALGFDVKVAREESHLCCGSAGTYSVLQPKLAYQLRDRKLGHLAALESQCIVSANIGCIQHLQTGTLTPVRHWVEVLDEALIRS
jgi:glycolate oxidase iron-sulfur subunit